VFRAFRLAQECGLLVDIGAYLNGKAYKKSEPFFSLRKEIL